VHSKADWQREKQKKLIFQKIAIWSSLVGPEGSWALVHRTTCTTCMAATERDDFLSAVKAYMSQINLQRGTTTVENRETTK